MFEVIDGRKTLLFRFAQEIRNDITYRRQLGIKEWETFDYVLEKCKTNKLKASEAALMLYMVYRLRND